MADWVNIANATIEPDAPLVSSTMFALRDNPKAIAEGAPGAPRVVDRALSTNATNAGRDWVLRRTALASVFSVGSYIFGTGEQAATKLPGNTISGQFLNPAGVSDNSDAGRVLTSGSAPGTWRCMGYAPGSTSTPVFSSATLWLRIA